MLHPTSRQTTRLELVASHRGPSAMAEIVAGAFRDHSASIQGMAVRSTRDPELAADITQEAFLRLVFEVQAGRCPDNVGGWLYRTSANLIVSRARRAAVARRLAPHLVRSDGPAQPDAIAVLREEHHELELALATLPADDRIALLMAAHGATGEEIADQLGRSHGATRTLISRARRRLKSATMAAEAPCLIQPGRMVTSAGAGTSVDSTSAKGSSQEVTMGRIQKIGREGAASFVGFGRGLWLFPFDAFFRAAGFRYSWIKMLFAWTPAPLLATIGRLRAERAASRASRNVPAYRRFLAEANVNAAQLFPLGILGHLPETDKRAYVDQFGLIERCVGGRVPFPGTTIDESSGSTGTPYNWIRGSRERMVAHRNIGFFARYAFGTQPLVTINAFSMGAWAAGFNMSLGMMRHGIVKSTGPDVDKILSTLRFLGPTYRYLISGYPPFIKHLLDEGDRIGFPWADYRLNALVGGEGVSEELRDYLLGRFVSVYSGYGATDIEIGMAGESPVSIALRRLARARPDVRLALFGTDSRLPMVFQYNPLIHYLEVNAVDEVICTVSRLDLLSPRIRYNVHDRGGILSHGQVRRILARFGYDLDTLNSASEVHGPRGPLPWEQPIPLPFLWINGRSDATISVMGANIYPEDIEVVLYRDPELARRIHSFLLTVVADSGGTPRPSVALELTDDAGVDDDWRAHTANLLRDGLVALNIDFRSSIAEFPAAMQPIVETYLVGAGPFAADAGRIKQRRIGYQ